MRSTLDTNNCSTILRRYPTSNIDRFTPFTAASCGGPPWRAYVGKCSTD